MIEDEIDDEIDEKMRGLVSILNSRGVPTTGSCEGHIDHGSPAPWVKVNEEDEKILQKAARFLEEFYKNRDVPRDVRFVMENANSGFWIHNGGEAYDRWRIFVNECVIKIKTGEKIKDYFDTEEQARRSEKLTIYQKEIELFTGFLKKTIK